MKKITKKGKIVFLSMASLLVLILLFSIILLSNGLLGFGVNGLGVNGSGIAESGVSGLTSLSDQKIERLLIPKPVNYDTKDGSFTLTDKASIYVSGNSSNETEEISAIAEYFVDILNPSTGYDLSVIKSSTPKAGCIYLTTLDGDSSLGNEGYKLDVTAKGVTISAFTAEGLFRGIQSIRQLLPEDIEKGTVSANAPWKIPCSSITDFPAYSWRGMMLDVARHFIGVRDVKRTIDLMAQYKMNKFHLHLSDDQGWRIEIKSWPNLTKVGGSKEVGGGDGGFYTQEEYIDIVNYAKERYITLIPEIDMPGHCNAALASYGELNPDGKKKELYFGTNVGFSSLMCRSEVTYTFINDVIGELAAITPGQYIHIGGDEAAATSNEDYNYFIGRVDKIVSSYGKKSIGWGPFDTSDGTTSDDLLQNWNGKITSAQNKEMKIIASPSDKAYIDMMYYGDTPIGLNWAGYSSTDDAYKWDPTDYAPENSIIGIECPLWTETVEDMDDIEYLAFPRLLGHAEVGWTPKALRNWDEYKVRLQSHGPRMENQEIDFFKDPVVSW